jgi:fumarate reductase subunit C
MVPLVIGHIVVMVYAVQGGLSAEEILGRTRGSLFWGAFYGLFVLAVATHAAIGLRAIANEWLRLEGAILNVSACLVGLGLLALGGRAVYAVIAS